MDEQQLHTPELENTSDTGEMVDIAPVMHNEIVDATVPKKEDARWYTIHTYAGYENAVERNLKQRIESLNMENKIFDVIVPRLFHNKEEHKVRCPFSYKFLVVTLNFVPRQLDERLMKVSWVLI
jgi:hypothetical protein